MKRLTKGFLLLTFAGIILAFCLCLVACRGEKGEQEPPPPDIRTPAEEKQLKSEPLDIGARFVASGWMGDGEYGTKYIELVEGWKENPHSHPVCIKIGYSPGPKGWGGIYWQNRPDNWGDKPGENFADASYKRVTFWAKGENGDEIVEFKAGGIEAPGKRYKDSFEVTLGKVTLKKEWQQYTMDLNDKDLSSVIGGFCWVANRSANPQGLTFYLDDILYDP
jgi:hypothetical protein